MPETTPDLLTVAQAAEDLGVSIRTIQNWIKSGRIEAVRPAGVGATYPYTIRATEVEKLKAPQKQ